MARSDGPLIEFDIHNLVDGETLPHSLVLIEGRVKGLSEWRQPGEARFLSCLSEFIKFDGEVGFKELQWPINGRGHFKVLCELQAGENRIRLQYHNDHNCCSHNMRLIYRPVQGCDHFVRLVYVVCADDLYGGCFQGPPSENDFHQYSAVEAFRRIALGAKLIQLFMAECLYRNGLPRRTFRLESDHEPICHNLILQGLTTDQAQHLTHHQLWCAIRDELAAAVTTTGSLANKTVGAGAVNNCKFLAFTSFTRYTNSEHLWPETHQDVVALTKAHIALGGGGLAVLGTGCLHTWAPDLSQLVQCFTDTTPVDKTQLLDDSGYRGTYWACYASTLGATCHELGHTFGLCHNSTGIMGQGFHNIHRVFILLDITPDGATLSNGTSEASPSSCCGSPTRKTQNLPTSQSATKSWSCSNGQDNSKGPSTPVCSVMTASSTAAFLQQLKLYRHLQDDWMGAQWNREEAVWLCFHKWFNLSCARNCKQGPTWNGLEVRSRHSLRIVILAGIEHGNGDKMVICHWDFLAPSGKMLFRLDIQDICQNLQSQQNLDSLHNVFSDFFIMAEDSYGNTMIETIENSFFQS